MKLNFAADPSEKSKVDPLTRTLIEFGPLGAFFVCYFLWDLMTATAAFIPAMLVSLFFSIRLERRVPLMRWSRRLSWSSSAA